MRSHGRIVALIAIVAVALCAPGLASAKEKKPKEPPPPIALTTPPAGKGQIVFFRPGGMGFAIACSVNEHGQKVSSLGAGKYFVMVADPGRHEFLVKSEAKDALAVEVEPDETQFVFCQIKMGVLVGRPDISPSTEEEFRKHPKMDLVDDDDMGPGPGALRSTDIAAALAGQPNPIASAPAAGAEPAAAPAEGAPAESAPADSAPANMGDGEAAPATAPEGEAAPSTDIPATDAPPADTPPTDAPPADTPATDAPPAGAPAPDAAPATEAAPAGDAAAAPVAAPEAAPAAAP